MLRRNAMSLEDGQFRRDLINERLSEADINDAITELNLRRSMGQNLGKYFLGENPTILARKTQEKESPNNKIGVPYARKLINTVLGYMFKPGSIQLNVDDEDYQEVLNSIFFDNGADSKTSKLGKHASIFGVAYEVHYTNNPTGNNPTPRFAPVPPEDFLPVYSNDIEPEIVAAIHRYTENNGREHINIYYEDIIRSYVAPRTIAYFGDMSFSEDTEHGYGMVPVAVYRNNDELTGDYEHILKLLDAYDILMSDSMNEFDRFAWAYLVLKNLAMSEEDLKDVKKRRVFEVFENGGVEFLTKDIQHEFISYMKGWIKEEIHNQTHIPDMSDENFAGNQSGIAIRYKLNDLENIASTKEIGFREGLHRRIQLLTAFLRTQGFNPVNRRSLKITFNHNIPANLEEQSKIIANLRGHVSHKTILDQVASFVDDSTEEIERLNEERDVLGGLDEEEPEEPLNEE